MQAEDSRVFNCRQCSKEVRICRPCDRGNVYCGKKCRKEARLETWRRSGAKSRKKERTRILHKIAQQRYLENREKKMTQQGSHREDEVGNSKQGRSNNENQAAKPCKKEAEPVECSSRLVARKRPQATGNQGDAMVRCTFCGCLCMPENRIGMLAVVRRERRGARHQYG